jgi:hypothetical protein
LGSFTRGTWSRLRRGDVVPVAAVLVTLATLLASLSWILSGSAAGKAGDLKTASLGYMMMRLEAMTEASNALVQAQTYVTQAAMYYAQAEALQDDVVGPTIEGLGDQSIAMSNGQALLAQQATARAEQHYDAYDNALARATQLGRTADRRSTAALIFNVAASLASFAVLLRRRGLLILFAPIFVAGFAFFVSGWL